MLSGAKHLGLSRPFAALRVTWAALLGACDRLGGKSKPHVRVNGFAAFEEVLVDVLDLRPGVAAAELLFGDAPEVVVFLDGIPILAGAGGGIGFFVLFFRTRGGDGFRGRAID